jgi:hypothetical protein
MLYARFSRDAVRKASSCSANHSTAAPARRALATARSAQAPPYLAVAATGDDRRTPPRVRRSGHTAASCTTLRRAGEVHPQVRTI